MCLFLFSVVMLECFALRIFCSRYLLSYSVILIAFLLQIYSVILIKAGSQSPNVCFVSKTVMNKGNLLSLRNTTVLISAVSFLLK